MGVLARGRRDADWLEVLDAVYAPASSLDRWGSGVVEAAKRLFHPSALVGLQMIRHDADLRVVENLVASGAGVESIVEETFPLMGPEALRIFYYPRSVVISHRTLERRLSEPDRQYVVGLRAAFGVEDVLGLVVHADPGVPGVLWAGSSERVELSSADSDALFRLALHVESGMRLRLRPEALRGVLRQDGKVEHLEPGEAHLASLQEKVKQIEAGRSRRAEVPGLHLWNALIGGRLSLVPRREGSRRFYYVMENAPASQPHRALSQPEMQVIQHAARGLTCKLVAYGLGVSSPTVSRHLTRVAAKVGALGPTELVRVAATLTDDPRAGFAEMKLSPAERAVLDLLRQGLSNAEIARIRNRSVRTIANQIAALLRKTGSASRRELVARA